MISIRSSYHPIEAAILWCDLVDHEAEILRVDLSHPGSLLKCFPQWPLLDKSTECIYDAIACGDLPATYLGCPISLSNQVHCEYCCIRRADLLVWFIRNFPDQKPKFLFPPNLNHAECISLNAHLVQQADLQASARIIEKLQEELKTSTAEMTALAKLNNELSARLEACGIPSELSEGTHNLLVGALLDVTLGKSKNGQLQSIYPSQAALVEAITIRFPGMGGLSKHTIDRRFADARRHLAQVLRG
ncbi:hypothetical protein CWR53_12620 [Pseudomonas sp. SGAir0191]|uniref:hypothetical protein n=1 Tax=Pseudomonas sp. SGAir0191 TaxID=2217867 RepID=UPI000C2C0F9A|nr:hypothetical protein [Pseudomonas sp. SGAir0191]AUA33376.1 hypothetical protein CWR53_12620 [Pseudomonas sp. SGAir0191]